MRAPDGVHLAAEGRVERTGRRLLLAAPPLAIALLVYAHGVDVPAQDQWDATAVLLEKWEAGTLRLVDFHAQLNEHRIFFPSLISFGMAMLTDWNTRAELFAIWLLAGICSFNLWRIARATGLADSTLGPWLLVAANALVFTPLQYENWLLGIQIVVLLPLACTTACAWIALSPRAWVRFVATAALAVISSFSMASGFLCWPLIFPLLWVRGGRVVWRGQRGWCAFWLASFALCVPLYLYGYREPFYDPDPFTFTSQPLSAIPFLLVYLGANFASGTALTATVVAGTAGSVLVALLAGCLGYLWRARADRAFVARALPWLVPPGLAIGNAALTTLGRMGLGIEQALMSRYIAFSIWLPIGLVFLVPLVFGHWRDRAAGQRAVARVGAALAAIMASFALLHVLNALANAPVWAEQQRVRRIAKALIELIDVADEEALHSYVNLKVVPRERVRAIDRLGFLHPGLVRSRSIAEIGDPRDPGSPAYGELENYGWTGSGEWGALGWAALPHAKRPADAVVITQDDPRGEPQIVALAAIGRPRKDVADAHNEPAYVRAGWIEQFGADAPPEGARFKAWAFDAELGRAYRISGEATVQR